ncbi:peptidyl-tRNA hydrolase Pth2 [Candidatus Woesearchaeota archaeon]|nr:peptidyl-tRNA hydrolase Pth2 [Candidatus Woesearchaeota archaeon]
MYKQVILVRKDLKLPKGKVGAQCSHASVTAVMRALKSRSFKDVVDKWAKEGMAKIVLKVNDKKELLKYIQMAKDMNLPTCTITDAGKTVVEPGTMTCGAIGPAHEDDIDVVTGELKCL